MEWKIWIGKKIFIRTKSGRVYSGMVQEVDDSNPHLIWLSMLDKFNDLVQFSVEEILEIKEED